MTIISLFNYKQAVFGRTTNTFKFLIDLYEKCRQKVGLKKVLEIVQNFSMFNCNGRYLWKLKKCLLRNFDRQKVYDEVVSVAGESAEICYYHLNKLKYTEMAINETMRIFPAVPIVARKVKEDLNIETRSFSNTQVVVNFFDMHRDEKIYTDPLVYDPNRFRFLTEEIEKRHPFSFLPFSGGPRNCIGWNYAQMVIKIAVANLVRNFHITTKHKSPAEIELESTIIMAPTNPLDFNFVPRWN